MSCYWLISSRSSLFCFRFSFFVAFILFCFFCIFLLVVVLLRLCFLLYASNYSQNIFPYHCGVLFFLVSYFCCSHDVFFLCIFLHSLFYFLLLKVMLSCGAAIFHSSPTSNISVKTVLIIFIIFTFFLLGLLSVLAWVFCNKN